MIFQSDNMQLKTIQTVLNRDCADVYVCRDNLSQERMFYTVIVVKDRETAKKMLIMFHTGERQKCPFLKACFSDKNAVIFVFTYNSSRLLVDFYQAGRYTISECEDICKNLILSCITSELPWPFLYLILKQRQIHMSRERNITLGYYVDLTELDGSITEKQCVVECARLLLELLEDHANGKAISYELLTKRVANSGYNRFTELYKDITIAAAPEDKLGIWSKIKRFFLIHKNAFFYLLLILCIILVVLVIISFFSQMIMGDIPWMRLLQSGFKQIGTESLLK